MTSNTTHRASQRQQRIFGLWSLVAFALMGIALETLHGLRVSWYMTQPVRREMLTLAHTHGTLLALIVITSSLFLYREGVDLATGRRSALLLRFSCILMPLGFLLGGVFANSTDPGIGILLVPAGALALIFGLILAIRFA